MNLRHFFSTLRYLPPPPRPPTLMPGPGPRPTSRPLPQPTPPPPPPLPPPFRDALMIIGVISSVTALMFQTTVLYPWHEELSRDIARLHADVEAAIPFVNPNLKCAVVSFQDRRPVT